MHKAKQTLRVEEIVPGKIKIVILKISTMKKLLPLIMLLSMLCSCVILDRARETEYWIADFRPYLEKDFMYTPHVYSGDHDILASVSIVIRPAAKTKKEFDKMDELYVRVSEMSDVYREIISPVEALEAMYEYALTLGANGVSELRTVKHEDGTFEIGGMAIFRK